MSGGKQGEAELQPDTVLRLQRENYNYYKVYNNHEADYNDNEENNDHTQDYDNYEEDNKTNYNNIVTEAVTRGRSDGRVTCHVCGSLFDTEAPPCPQFDRNDPAQTKTCDAGEAFLYYKQVAES